MRLVLYETRIYETYIKHMILLMKKIDTEEEGKIQIAFLQNSYFLTLCFTVLFMFIFMFVTCTHILLSSPPTCSFYSDKVLSHLRIQSKGCFNPITLPLSFTRTVSSALAPFGYCHFLFLFNTVPS